MTAGGQLLDGFGGRGNPRLAGPNLGWNPDLHL
jgi:hypothetical protein